jgi:hypothetical protein
MKECLQQIATLTFVLAVAGCASGGGERDERLADVLAGLDTDTEYAATQRCLSTFEYDRVEVLDERHLLFRNAPGNDVWLNILRSRCPGLHRNDTLLFEKSGSRLCSLDRAEVIDRFLFWRRTGPVCALGEFHQLTDAQAALIREATR